MTMTYVFRGVVTTTYVLRGVFMEQVKHKISSKYTVSEFKQQKSMLNLFLVCD